MIMHFLGRVIRHRACALRDTAYAYTKAELDPEFEKTCLDIAESRKRRGKERVTYIRGLIWPPLK